MANKLGARKNSRFLAICTAPDFCKTPVGSSTPPLPYQVIADLGQSDNTVANVRFTGNPCYVLDQSIVPHCTGDEPGTAKGVKSGTVTGKVEPTRASKTVRATGKQIVRDLDPCTLNGGNCTGIHTTQPAPGCAVAAGGEPNADTKPAVQPNAREKDRLERLASWWDQKKTEMGAAVENPGQGAIGALKDTANTVPELGEMIARGSGHLQAAQLEQSAKLAKLLGLKQTADNLQAEASIMRQIADKISFTKFELSNAAQAGGADIALGLQLATGVVGLAKGAAKVGVKALAKSGSRALAGEADDVARAVAKGSTAAREIKAADSVGDAARAEQAVARESEQLAKTGEVAAQGGKKAPKGGGVRIEKPPMSLREEYLGRTPGKGSKTGKEVIERMRKEGKIREGLKGTEFQASNGKWYPLEKADMAHKVDAVTWWNETGRQYGARTPEVRKWMLDSNNYTLEHFSKNRSLGAVLGQTQRYLPPP
jgi:hypothetical protein